MKFSVYAITDENVLQSSKLGNVNFPENKKELKQDKYQIQVLFKRLLQQDNNYDIVMYTQLLGIQ